MADATTPNTIDLAQFMQAAQQYKNDSQTFAGKVGMVFNPMTGGYVQDPNFLTPLQKQQLANERTAGSTSQLQLQAMTNPDIARSIAQNQSQAAFASPQTQEAHALIEAKQKAIGDLQTAAANFSQQKMIYANILGRIPGAANLIPGYAEYHNALLAAQSLGIDGLNGLIPGQEASASLQTIGQGLQTQAAGYTAPNAAPVVPMAPVNGNPYDSTAPAMISPAQLGANAHGLYGGGQ